MNIFLRIWPKLNKPVKHYRSIKSRRIFSIIERANFVKAYIKVSYGLKECNFGCLCEFYNDGTYKNKQELKSALRMFLLES